MKRQSGRTWGLNFYVMLAVVVLAFSFGLIYLINRQGLVLTPLTSSEIDAQNREALRINTMIFQTQEQLHRLKQEDLQKTKGQNQQMYDKMLTNLQLITDDYERILDLRYNGVKVNTEEQMFSDVLNAAKQNNVALTDQDITKLMISLSTQKNSLFVSAAMAAGPAIPAGVPAINQAPASGYRRQKVTAGGRAYLVDIVAADLGSTKVIADTASDGTCGNNCPVLPLASYVGRSGAYAGINGTYFCPDTYPSCAGKTNSFDTLMMNKNKVYLNSDNNVYSTVPAVIFSPGSARFVTASRDWGRDTGVDAVIANRPLLTLDGNIMFGGGGEAKENIRGNRSFVGATGSTAYIGVIRNATLAEAATVLQTMEVRSSLNLDDGGSTALWSGGYKLGPGRRLPNVILFTRR